MLEIKNLVKRYGNAELPTVKGISFSVKDGEIFGFLGSNGAGKTTTIKCLCGILPFDEGEILIDGIDIKKHPYEAKIKIQAQVGKTISQPFETTVQTVEYLSLLPTSSELKDGILNFDTSMQGNNDILNILSFEAIDENTKTYTILPKFEIVEKIDWENLGLLSFKISFDQENSKRELSKDHNNVSQYLNLLIELETYLASLVGMEFNATGILANGSTITTIDYMSEQALIVKVKKAEIVSNENGTAKVKIVVSRFLKTGASIIGKPLPSVDSILNGIGLPFGLYEYSFNVTVTA